MGTVLPSSTIAMHEGEDVKDVPQEAYQVNHHNKDLDAGALFVLKSNGNHHLRFPWYCTL